MVKFVLAGANIYITLIFIILHIIIFIMFDGTINPEEELYQKIHWECRDSFLYHCVYSGIFMIMFGNLIMCFVNGLCTKKTRSFFIGAIYSFLISQIVSVLYYATKWYNEDFSIYEFALWIRVASIALIIIFGVLLVWEKIIGHSSKMHILFIEFCVVDFMLLLTSIYGSIIFMSFAEPSGDLYGLAFLLFAIPSLVVFEIIGGILAVVLKIFDSMKRKVKNEI